MIAWVRFLRAHAQLTRELGARLEADHGLTMSDYDVLIQLYFAEEHAMRRVDIARQVLLTASGITRLLDGLERCGLVGKKTCASDARVSYAVLTEEGLRKVEAARDTHLADVEELFGSQFSPDERKQLGELLGRLPLAHTAEACET
ncbi:MAG TPA: MarR family transcriptional regulator [Gaiellaceae bacterium]|nr:MarR family transcriptional regulator [Gaiellaceae bacterium]